MTLAEKLEVLAEVLDRDVDEVKPETELETIGWDSISMLGVIAMAKTRIDKKIPGAKIREFETVQDILSALE